LAFLPQSVTIAGALKAACELLTANSARDNDADAKVDAQVLLCHVLDQTTTHLYTWPEKILTAEQANAFEQLVSRRNAGEPVAYLTGERGFWTLNLKTSNCTLIPRADTECLVECALELLPLSRAKVLDLGTGTGAIALALASENPKWQVHGCDYNKEAVALARLNAQQCALELGGAKVNFIHSDWFSAYTDSYHHDFDLIVSNPPYIAPDDQHLLRGDLRYEPTTALVAEDNGYSDICHIIGHAKHFLKPGGILMLEHGFEQGEKVRQYFDEHGYIKVSTRKDYSQNERFTFGYVVRGQQEANKPD
jgi:release factor glutamine methyltransferase